MANASVLVYIESRYKASRKRIKRAVETVLFDENMQTPVEVSVAIVGDRKMRSLNKKYRNLDKTTNVLSFPLSEGQEAVQPASNIVRLGDIVISYPQVIKEAARDEVMVDDKIEELVIHSMYHLLGVHH
jgi:probable rRNA maturation factor